MFDFLFLLSWKLLVIRRKSLLFKFLFFLWHFDRHVLPAAVAIFFSWTSVALVSWQRLVVILVYQNHLIEVSFFLRLSVCFETRQNLKNAMFLAALLLLMQNIFQIRNLVVQIANFGFLSWNFVAILVLIANKGEVHFLVFDSGEPLVAGHGLWAMAHQLRFFRLHCRIVVPRAHDVSRLCCGSGIIHFGRLRSVSALVLEQLRSIVDTRNRCQARWHVLMTLLACCSCVLWLIFKRKTSLLKLLLQVIGLFLISFLSENRLEKRVMIVRDLQTVLTFKNFLCGLLILQRSLIALVGFVFELRKFRNRLPLHLDVFDWNQFHFPRLCENEVF